MALHVGAGIALDVALGLGGGEDFLVAPPGLRHLGQDEVGAAVDDAAHAPDVVGRQVAGDRIEHGRAAADRRLEPERRALRAGDLLQLRAVVGQDVLVGRDDRLARVQRLGDQRAGRLVAAQQLDDHVHVVAPDHGRGIGDDDLARHAPIDGALDVHVGDGHELEHSPARGADLPVRAAQEASGHLRADGARAEDRDAEWSSLGGHGRVGLGPARPSWDRSRR